MTHPESGALSWTPNILRPGSWFFVLVALQTLVALQVSCVKGASGFRLVLRRRTGRTAPTAIPRRAVYLGTETTPSLDCTEWRDVLRGSRARADTTEDPYPAAPSLQTFPR